MENVEAITSKVNSFLDKVPAVNGPITKLSEKLKVDRAYIALGILLVPILIIFVLGAGDFLVDIVGFVYPAYASIKAVESDRKDDDSLWLTYWIIFCLFKVSDSVIGSLLNMIPFFLLIKLAFLVWCYHPSTEGARVIYQVVVKAHIAPALGLQVNKEKVNKSE